MAHRREKCPLCSSSVSRVLFTRQKIAVKRCGECGFVYLDVARSREELRSIYTDELFASEGLDKYYLDNDGTPQANGARHLRFVETHRKGGRILDVGCGFGYFLRALGAGWSAQGVEISSFAAERARSRTGLTVVNADFIEAELEPQSWDVVTMWDYIEHVPNPLENLQKAYFILQPGGMLFLSTPDRGSLMARLTGRYWYHYDPLQHLCYFDCATLSLVLRTAGFEIVDKAHYGRYFNTEYLAYRFKYSYQGFWGNAMYRVSRGVLSILRPKSPSIYLNPRDVVTVCAAKPESRT